MTSARESLQTARRTSVRAGVLFGLFYAGFMALFMGNFTSAESAAMSIATWATAGVATGVLFGGFQYWNSKRIIAKEKGHHLATTYAQNIALRTAADDVFAMLTAYFQQTSNFTLKTSSAEFGTLVAHRKRTVVVLGHRINIALRPTSDGVDVRVESTFASPTISADSGYNHATVQEILDALVTTFDVEPLKRESVSSTSTQTASAREGETTAL